MFDSTTMEPPEGLRLVTQFLSVHEETILISQLRCLIYAPVCMRGVSSKRSVSHFGWEYLRTSKKLRPGPPIPQFLIELRDRCSNEAGHIPSEYSQVIVSRYPAGAGIGMHRDAPIFGHTVLDM